MSEEELLIKLSEVYEEVRKQKEYLKKQGFNDEQILVIGNLVANKEYLAKKELSKYKVRLEKCRKQKRKVENACHNYKVIIEKAIEYVKHSKNKRIQLGLSDRGLQEFEVQDLLKILEGVEYD